MRMKTSKKDLFQVNIGIFFLCDTFPEFIDLKSLIDALDEAVSDIFEIRGIRDEGFIHVDEDRKGRNMFLFFVHLFDDIPEMSDGIIIEVIIGIGEARERMIRSLGLRVMGSRYFSQIEREARPLALRLILRYIGNQSNQIQVQEYYITKGHKRLHRNEK